jgi:translation initiation factor IF-2
MAEEKEKKPKKKTTLIKHKKQTPLKTEEKTEKKKVVVIKKKVIRVKRTDGQKRAVSSKGIAAGAAAAKKKSVSVGKEGKPGARPSRPGYLGSSPREPSPFELQAQGPRPKADREAGGKQPRAGRRQIGVTREGESGAAATRERSRRQSIRARTETGRPTGAVRERGQRRGFVGRGKGPESPRAQFATPSSAPPAKKAEEVKHGAKKFFKTRKKTGYQRKREEEHQEKLLPLKKKVVQRANPVPKEISILEAISVSELAKKMNLKASDLIAKLMGMGMMVTINEQIDAETAAILADEYNCKVNVVSLYDETVIEEEEDLEENLEPRSPIVTVMGHVDHGKTKLLDSIRKTNVVDSEHGGITQHIGAYTVEFAQGKITFLDTPGHEAFTSMRARGAQITDIVVLVVAADDGVMPQTVEAINHAREANVPIVVAINKMDLEDANPERVKQQLAEYDLLPEEWGGHTLYAEVSALKNTGISSLLETILLQAEILELKANYNCRALGKIVESKIDLGRGIVATVLIEKGTLRTGDSFIAGIYPGKVRAMFNDKGERIENATPSAPVEILGFTGLPNAGDPFHVTESEKAARQIGLKRQELKKMENASNVNKITLDNLYDQIKQGEVQELKVIVKGDVHGSVEALQLSLEKLSTNEIRLVVIHSSAGAINDNDVLLAAASNAIIIGFHVRPTPSATSIAEREKVEIRRYSVIYDAVDDIRSAMEGLLAPELKEELIGVAEVRDTFKVPKVGIIGGCYVANGKIQRGAQAHLIRDGVEIYTGKIASLKRFKDDVREVESGFECGISIENFNDIKVGDQLEVFEIKKLAKKLEESGKGADDQKKEN